MGKFSDMLFVSDFDRTITDLDGDIPQKNIDAIEYFIKNGGIFTIATGRNKNTFRAQAEKLPINAPCIVANGALIYDYRKDETISITELPQGAEQLLDTLMKLYPEAGLEIYQPDEFYAFGDNEMMRRHFDLIKTWPKREQFEKVSRPWIKAVFSGAPEVLGDIAEYVDFYAPEFASTLSLPYLLEVHGKDIGKGAASRSLAESLGRSVLVCAGDARNDISLLAEGDISFVPGDGDSGLLELYRKVAPCTEGSLADIIIKLEEETK